MGLKISNLNKKLFICSLGIIFLTYGICLFYKKQTIKEGLLLTPDDLVQILAVSVSPPVAASTGTLSSLIETSLSQEVTLMGENHLAATQQAIKNDTIATQIAKKNNMAVNANIKKNETNIIKNQNNLSKQQKQEAKTIAQQHKKEIQQAKQEIEQKSALQAKKQEMQDRARAVVNKFSNFKMLAMIGMLYEWGLPFVQCGWYWFKNIRQCFFWYLLDTIGQILYLPFGLLIWIFPILEPPSDLFWKTLDDLDCLCFDATGYHFLHYSPDIIRQCFSCNPKDLKELTKFPEGLGGSSITNIPKFDISDLFQVI